MPNILDFPTKDDEKIKADNSKLTLAMICLECSGINFNYLLGGYIKCTTCKEKVDLVQAGPSFAIGFDIISPDDDIGA